MLRRCSSGLTSMRGKQRGSHRRRYAAASGAAGTACHVGWEDDRVDAGPRKRAAGALRAARSWFTEQSLSRAERRLIRAAVLGELYAPANVGAATVRPEVLRWLLTVPEVAEVVDTRGIVATRIRVEHELDLANVHSTLSLTLASSTVKGGVNLRAARFSRIDLSGSDVQGAILLEGAEIGTLDLRGARVSGNGVHALSAALLRVSGDVVLQNAQFAGEVDFRGSAITGQLRSEDARFLNADSYAFSAPRAHFRSSVFFRRAEFVGRFDIIGAAINGSLGCDKAEFRGADGFAFEADGVIVKGGFFLSGAAFLGMTRLPHAEVRGQIFGPDVSFTNPTGAAFVADGATVHGDIQLDRAKVVGAFRLPGATIRGQLTLIGSRLTNLNEVALLADQMEITASVIFDHTVAAGGVRLQDARIGGRLSCRHVEFSCPDGASLRAEGLRTTSVSLEHSSFVGAVNFLDATLDQLDCENATFSGGSNFMASSEGAFSLERATVTGGALFACAAFTGEVRLLLATIHMQLNCVETRFSNAGGLAINGDGATLHGIIKLTKSEFVGETRFPGAKVLGELDCTDSRFKNVGGVALHASGAEFMMDCYLSHAEFHGEVRLTSMTAKGNVDCRGSRFTNTNGVALNASSADIRMRLLCEEARFDGQVVLSRSHIDEISAGGATISGCSDERALDLRRLVAVSVVLPNACEGRVDAEGAQIEGMLLDWPAPTVPFETVGLTYRLIDLGSDAEWKNRIESLRSPSRHLHPGSFDELARAYRRSGHIATARRVLIAREREITRRGGFSWARRGWRNVQWYVTGYGFKPFRAVIASGAVILSSAATTYFILPDREWASPSSAGHTAGQGFGLPPALHHHAYRSLLFAADRFLPIVDFGEEKNRVPAGSAAGAWALFIALAVLGWLLVTILVTAYTRVVVRSET
jgi:uncharacterized protein YjbI with pentapeptide repeats